MVYDVYTIEYIYLFYFLKYVKENHLKVLHLKYEKDICIFYIPTYQRLKLKTFRFPLVYIKSIGYMQYVLYFIKNIHHFIMTISFFIALLFYTSLIFDVKVIGTIPSLNKDIINQLTNKQIDRMKLLKDDEQLNYILLELKTIYKEKVEYLNIYQNGSIFYVEYTKRSDNDIGEDNYSNLYASRDGLIQSIDIDSGIVKVKINDYVKKGDLLIENTIISTQNETSIIPVKGKIYAYTFHQFSASASRHKHDHAEVFYYLLLKIRNQLPIDALIDKENVLQIQRTSSKITLKVHYTLIEEITTKGEVNEGSH